MRVIVTGRHGQLARCLANCAPAEAQIVFASRPDFDLQEPERLASMIRAQRPQLIINAGAYTQVDAAEREADLALRINGQAPGVLAGAAAEIGALFVQVSTDYVFNGQSITPYREDARPDPLNVYGRTKLAGERAVAGAGCDFIIARVSWLFSEFGRNFVRTMLTLASDRDVVNVVSDQRGAPTYAGDVAEAIWRMAAATLEGSAPGRTVVNAVNGDVCTWADFAEAIFASSARVGGPVAQVRRVGTSAFPTPARRPANSVLDVGKMRDLYGISMPSWRVSLDSVVAIILDELGWTETQAERRNA